MTNSVKYNLSWSKFFDYSNFGLLIFLIFCSIFKNNILALPSLAFIGKMHLLMLHVPIGAYIFMLLIHFIAGEDIIIENQRSIALQTIVFFTLITCITGLFHSLNGDYNASQLNLHFYGALIFAILIYLMQYFNDNKRLFNITSIIAAITLIYAGHNGGVLTHGENVFVQTSKGEAKKNTANTVYAKMIQPIFDEKCISCHNKQKHKGDLLLIDSASIMKGGKNGAIITLSNLSLSKIYSYAMLPMKDEKHMPPDGKPQLTNDELSILKYWIKSGASFSQNISTISATDSLYPYLIKLTNTKPEKTYTFAAADEKVIHSISSPYLYISSLSADGPALQARFFVAKKFDPSNLEKLEQVKNQLIHLDLGGMPLNDNHLASLPTFVNLEKIILNGCPITSKGLQSLIKLKNLESIAASNTQVDANVFTYLAQWPKLKNVSLANTSIDDNTLQQWKSKNPKINVIVETKISGKLPLTIPKLKNESPILEAMEYIEFEPGFRGSQIKYTLDGSEPDSINSAYYKDKIMSEDVMRVRAIAVKDQWLHSPELDATFFHKGLTPSSCTLLTQADKKYQGQSFESFTNNALALVTNLTDENWIAYRDNKFKAIFEFKEPLLIQKIFFSYGIIVPSYVFPPTEIRVYGANDKKNFVLLQKKNPPIVNSIDKDKVKNDYISLIISSKEKFKFYKIEADNLTKIPKWHAGKGEKGWLFIDEIFFHPLHSNQSISNPINQK